MLTDAKRDAILRARAAVEQKKQKAEAQGKKGLVAKLFGMRAPTSAVAAAIELQAKEKEQSQAYLEEMQAEQGADGVDGVDGASGAGAGAGGAAGGAGKARGVTMKRQGGWRKGKQGCALCGNGKRPTLSLSSVLPPQAAAAICPRVCGLTT